MRITQQMMTDTVLTNLSANLGRMEELQRQLSSGRRLARPSDDPPGVTRALDYRASITANESYLRTIDSSLAWLNTTDSTLDSMGTFLQRARELAVQGANDTLGPSQKADLATEVDQILQQLVTLGNASLKGQRLFGGLKTDVNPFSLTAGNAAVVYSGDSGQLIREIDVNSTVAINIPGSALLPGVFQSLIDLRDHLRLNDSASIHSIDLPALDQALDTVLEVRADVGARTNRLESARERTEQTQVRLKDLQSKIEDTDFAEAVSRFTIQENVYKAALAAGSKAIQPSLLDYLR